MLDWILHQLEASGMHPLALVLLALCGVIVAALWRDNKELREENRDCHTELIELTRSSVQEKTEIMTNLTLITSYFLTNHD